MIEYENHPYGYHDIVIITYRNKNHSVEVYVDGEKLKNVVSISENAFEEQYPSSIIVEQNNPATIEYPFTHTTEYDVRSYKLVRKKGILQRLFKKFREK